MELVILKEILQENILQYFIPFAILLFLLDMLADPKGKHHSDRDSICNLIFGVLNQSTILITKLPVLILYHFLFENFSLFNFDMNSKTVTLFMGILGFILVDLLFYLSHRIEHKYKFLWGTHQIHHQSKYMNFSVAARNGFLEQLIQNFLLLPLAFLGVPVFMMVTLRGFSLIYQFFTHSRFEHKIWEKLDFILVTPKLHHVHHSAQTKFINHNFSATFIIWDKLFGTYKKNHLNEKIIFGAGDSKEAGHPVVSNLKSLQYLLAPIINVNFLRPKISYKLSSTKLAFILLSLGLAVIYIGKFYFTKWHFLTHVLLIVVLWALGFNINLRKNQDRMGTYDSLRSKYSG